MSDLQPLARGHVTAASRVMLPAYGIFNTCLGAAWAFQDPARTNPSLRSMAEWWPVPMTGVVLLTLGVWMILNLLLEWRVGAALNLVTTMVVFCIIGYLFARTLEPTLLWNGDGGSLLPGHSWPVMRLANPTTSMSVFMWPFFVAVAALASLRSVMADEYTGRRGNEVP